MTRGIPVDLALKSEILDQIDNHGVSGYKVGQICHASGTVARNWIQGEILGGEQGSILKNNRLKKELSNAYRAIGKSIVGYRPKTLCES